MPPGTPLPKVSVALCAYNGERFLEQQLESLAPQTVPLAELLVCDDCSSDGTPAILRRFSRTAPFPARIFRNELRRVCRLIAARAYRSRESGGLGRSALIRDLREVVLSRRGAATVSA